MHLQIGAGVGEQSEADRVALGKAVEREGLAHLDDFLDAGGRHPFFLQRRAQLCLDAFQPRKVPLVIERAAQFVHLRAGEPGQFHRHAHYLFLEHTDAQRAFEDRLEPLVEVRHGFAPVAPGQIRVQQAALDGTRTHDGNLDHHIVEAAWLQPR